LALNKKVFGLQKRSGKFFDEKWKKAIMAKIIVNHLNFLKHFSPALHFLISMIVKLLPSSPVHDAQVQSELARLAAQKVPNHSSKIISKIITYKTTLSIRQINTFT
jgi:hypothetical protein